jgi:hypothetical protein
LSESSKRENGRQEPQVGRACMREVRVYEHDFPRQEQTLAGDPDVKFPKEVWLQQVQPGVFSLGYAGATSNAQSVAARS